MHGKQIALAALAAGCFAASAAAAQYNNSAAEGAGGYESLGAVPPAQAAVKQQIPAQVQAGQTQIDPAALQQIVSKINTAAAGQQAQNRPDQTAMQQQMTGGQAQPQAGAGQMPLDPAIQQGMMKKMEETMRQGLADTGAIQEMQKKNHGRANAEESPSGEHQANDDGERPEADDRGKNADALNLS